MSNIFSLTSVDLENPNFSDNTTQLPPPGWITLGSVGLSYDTSTPYSPGGVAVNIGAPLNQAGGLQSNPFFVKPGQYITLKAAARCITFPAQAAEVLVQLTFFDGQGNILLTQLVENTASTVWRVVTVQGTVPAKAASCVVQFLALNSGSLVSAYGEVGNVSVTLNSAALYYLSLFTSQYQNSPKLLSWSTALLKPFVDAGICMASMYQAFDLDTAVGVQLDILGQILGQSRTLGFTPTTGSIDTLLAVGNTGAGYTVGDTLTVVESGGASGGTAQVLQRLSHGLNFNYVLQLLTGGTLYTTAENLSVTGGTGTGLLVNITVTPGNSVLDDDTYRLLLKAKVAFNQWNGQIDTLYPIWEGLFPGGRIIVTDNMDMTASISLGGTFNSLITQIINAGLIIPRPQGVQYIYAFSSSPLFGFDLSNLSVAGFDTGVWE